MVSEEEKVRSKDNKLGQTGPNWAKLGQAGSSWAKLSQAESSWAKLGQDNGNRGKRKKE